MSSIIDYVKYYSNQTFSERPISDVDSLVLSQLSYLRYDGFVNDTFNFDKKLSDILKMRQTENLYNGVRVANKNKDLIKSAAKSIRFSNIKLGYYINEVDNDTEKQFSAITFKLDKNLYYVAYRGTDNSFIGWKEDLNMSFMPSVPAQNDAVNYFKTLGNNFPTAWFILGGHSKGGNLAVYAGVFSEDKIQNKICHIYNHDGPGFRNGILDPVSLDKIRHRMSKTMPQSSIVGMLMQQYEPYKVIMSNGFAIMQHDPFTWKIDCIKFSHADDITDLSKSTGIVVKDWIDNTDDETRHVFADAVFRILLNTNAASFKDLLTDLKGNTALIRNTIKTTDPNIKKTVSKSLYEFFSAVTHEIKKNTSNKLSGIQFPRPKFVHKDDSLPNIPKGN